MSIQTKHTWKKSAIVISFENFYKGKIYIKKFLFLCFVKITEICNNAIRPPLKGPPHMAIYFFMNSFC